jgi:hypothetical protein
VVDAVESGRVERSEGAGRQLPLQPDRHRLLHAHRRGEGVDGSRPADIRSARALDERRQARRLPGAPHRARHGRQLDVISSGGRLSAIEITPNDAYEQLVGEVHSLAPQVGWSDSAVAAFDAEITASRQASGGDSFTATIGPAASTGMRVSATLSGDSNTTPKLVIHLGATSR